MAAIAFDGHERATLHGDVAPDSRRRRLIAKTVLDIAAWRRRRRRYRAAFVDAGLRRMARSRFSGCRVLLLQSANLFTAVKLAARPISSGSAIKAIARCLARHAGGADASGAGASPTIAWQGVRRGF